MVLIPFYDPTKKDKISTDTVKCACNYDLLWSVFPGIVVFALDGNSLLKVAIAVLDPATKLSKFQRGMVGVMRAVQNSFSGTPSCTLHTPCWRQFTARRTEVRLRRRALRVPPGHLCLSLGSVL